jgi:hypothetical protein
MIKAREKKPLRKIRIIQKGLLFRIGFLPKKITAICKWRGELHRLMKKFPGPLYIYSGNQHSIRLSASYLRNTCCDIP